MKKLFIVESNNGYGGVETIVKNLQGYFEIQVFENKYEVIKACLRTDYSVYDTVVFNQPLSTFLISIFNNLNKSYYLVHINFRKGKILRRLLADCFFYFLKLKKIEPLCFSSGLGESVGIPYTKISAPVLKDVYNWTNGEKKSVDYLFVGRLEYQKGADLLVDIANGLYRGSSSKLVVVGGGTFEMMVNKSPHIKFLGPKNRTETLAIMKKSKLLIVPSRFEGLGFVIVEALSVGCRVVSFDCDYGPRDIKMDCESGMILCNNVEEMVDISLTFNDNVIFNTDNYLIDNFINSIN